MPAKKPKVLVAMSGGVDSSVAAALLVRRGYEVVGCFMRLGSPGETLDELTPAEDACRAGATTSTHSDDERSGSSRSLIQFAPKIKVGHQGCCSISDAADARLVAAHLNIPFYVCNFKKDFGRIIDYFADEYVGGRTPNPCVRCNDWLKFGKLHEYAGQIGADFVASGHYARIGSRESRIGGGRIAVGSAREREIANDADDESSNRRDSTSSTFFLSSSSSSSSSFHLLRGLDHSKDQSYVLFGIPRDQLARTLFPIGHLPKSRVRELAKEFGLPVFDKPDSQEICFVPDNDYAGLVERCRPDAARPGPIVDLQGDIVGEHSGQHQFTIGQRRGVAVALGRPVYVVAKDAATNTVTIGPREALARSVCTAGEANWLTDERRFEQWTPVFAKYRYNSAPVAAQTRLVEPPSAPTAAPPAPPSGRTGRFDVRFNEPQTAVAPGQAIVLYDAADPDAVLGGGWIESTR